MIIQQFTREALPSDYVDGITDIMTLCMPEDALWTKFLEEDNPDGSWWVVMCEEGCVAFMYIDQTFVNFGNPESLDGAIRINLVCTHPNQRGKGYAKALVRMMKDMAIKDNCLITGVCSQLTHLFWKKLGCEVKYSFATPDMSFRDLVPFIWDPSPDSE